MNSKDRKRALIKRIYLAEEYKSRVNTDKKIDYYDSYIRTCKMQLYSCEKDILRHKIILYSIIFGVLLIALLAALLFFPTEKEILLSPLEDPAISSYLSSTSSSIQSSEDISGITTNTKTTQFGAVIGYPVAWKEEVSLSQSADILIEIPEVAFSISITESESGSSTPPQFPTNQTNQTETNITISNDTEINTTINESNLSEPDILLSPPDFLGEEKLKVPHKWKSPSHPKATQEIPSDEIIDSITLEYTTPGPFVESESILVNGKSLSIKSPESLIYDNVLAFTTLPSDFKDKTSNIKVKSSSSEEVSINRIEDRGGEVYIEWIIPELDDQGDVFDIVIEVLNVQSYPTIGGQWTVEFTTLGKADLVISTIQETTWSNENELGDLKFLELKCGDTTETYEWTDNTVKITDYECDDMGYETSQVLTLGVHNLQFQFGDEIAFANNFAGGVGDDAILVFASTLSQDVESATAISFDGESRKDAPFTHDTITNPERITITDTGIYKISYNCAFTETAGGNRLIEESWIRKNGATEITPSKSSCYIRDTETDRNRCSNQGVLIAELSSGDFLELMSQKISGAGSSPVVSDACWMYIQKVNNNQVAQIYDSDGGDSFSDSTEITLDLDSLTYEDSGTFTSDTANDRIEVDSDGWYKIYFHSCSDGNAQNNRQTPQTYLRKNGAKITPTDTYSYIRNSGAGGDRNCESGYVIQDLLSGDYIDIRHLKFASESSGTSSVTLAGQSWLLLEKLDYEDVLMVYDAAGGQTVASGSSSAINFDTNYEVGSSYSHSIDSTQVSVNQDGWYEVSYTLGWIDDGGNDRYIGCANLRKNGVTDLVPSRQCDYSRGDFEARYNSLSTNTIINLVDTDYLELMFTSEGSAADTMPNSVWMTITPLDTILNSPPTTPTEITCDGSTNCNVVIDTNILLEGSGSTDSELDNIEYYLEAFLETSTSSGDIESSVIQVLGELGDSFTDIHYQGFETGPGGWNDPGGDSLLSSPQSFVDNTGAPGGTSSWRLRDNSGTSHTEQIFDFTGYDRVDVSWNSYFTNIESGETLTFLCNGNIVWTYDVNTQGIQDTWLTSLNGQGINILPTDCGLGSFNGAVTLRFESEFSNNNDHVFIDGIDIKGVNTGVANTEAFKDWTTYNDVFSTSFPPIIDIEIEVLVSNYDNSGSTQNANTPPDLEVEMFNGASYVSAGVLGISGTGTYSLNIANPTILTSWRTPGNTDLRVRGINFDYYDSSNFDEISFTDVIVSVTENGWTEIGNHPESTTFNWDTSLLQEQSCIDLRTRSIDPLGSNVYSNYFTKGSCLEINHPDPPAILDIEDISPQIVTESGTTNTVFTVLVSDPDGVDDLDDTSVTSQFSKSGEDTRIGSCSWTSDLDTTTAEYSCTVGIEYWDSAGTWTVESFASDIGGLNTPAFSEQFTLLETSCISISSNSLTWNTLFPGETDKLSSSNPTTISNTCNKPGGLEILGSDLLGMTDNSYTIQATSFSVDTSNSCDIGTTITTSTTTISGANLQTGDNSIGEGELDLYFCLEVVPTELKAQGYSTSAPGSSAWTITLAAGAISINRRKRKKKQNLLKLNNALIEKHGIGLEELIEKYGSHLDKLITKYKNSEKEKELTEVEIPTCIFQEEMSPAESISKYLKENLGLRFTDIAKVLNRNERTIWINYRNANKRKSTKIRISKSSFYLKAGLFTNRKLSILESAVLYLKSLKLSNQKIASILGKGSNNIWTLDMRAKKKLEN